MVKFILVVLVSLLSFSAQAVEGFGIQEGTEYKKTTVKIPTSHEKSVIELFVYNCIHCYNVEPSIYVWKQTKAPSVHFERVPAVFDNPNWIFMARVFYTAKLLGILDKSHMEYFHALHRDNKPLFDLDSIAKFHAQFGTTEQAFKDTFNSFMVDQKVRKAMQLTRASGITAVPAVVINGKYRTDVPMAGGIDALWEIVDTLVKR